MRKSVIVCLLILAAFSTGKAWSSSCQYQCFNCCGIKEASAEFSLGTRTDDFEWKFTDKAVDGLLSEIAPLLEEFLPPEFGQIITLINGTELSCLIDSALGFSNTYRNHWKKLRMANIGLEGRVDTDCCFYARGKFNYGWICDGNYEPTGYHRGSAEFFENIFADFGLATPSAKRSKGHVWDISGGIGYNMKFCCDTFEFAPLVGWSYHDVCFRTDCYKAETALGLDVGDLFGGEIALVSNSKAKYNAHWTGPWIGFDTRYQWDCKLSFVASFQYHYSRQHGSGSVNSATELILGLDDTEIEGLLAFGNSYKTCVNLRGVFIGGGFNYDINECWYAGFHVDYWNMRKANTGDLDLCSRSFFGDAEDALVGIEPVKRHYCLDSMKWESLRFNLVLGKNF